MTGREIAEITAAYQAALVQLGISTIGEVLAIFRRVDPTSSDAAADQFIEEMGELVYQMRGPSRELGVAYYRLIRALRTGTTTPDPREVSRAPQALSTLRREFHELVVVNATDPDTGEVGEAPSLYDPNRPGGDERVEIDMEFADELQAELDELERLFFQDEDGEQERLDAELRKILDEAREQSRTQFDRDELTANEYDAKQSEANDKTAAKAASQVEKSVLDASRKEVGTRSTRDRKALGYARISTSGTPCGFCAMLISRGAVYRSERVAEFGYSGSQYHPNCHCTSIPVFSWDEYETDEIFALNRRLHQEWKQHGGSLRVWRRYIDKKNARARSLRSDTQVQEATQ